MTESSDRSDTKTLIGALRILAVDIQSGVANAVIAEAADRLEELQAMLEPKIWFGEGGEGCRSLEDMFNVYIPEGSIMKMTGWAKVAVKYATCHDLNYKVFDTMEDASKGERE